MMITFTKSIWSGKPKAMQRLHARMTIAWFIAAFPVCLFLAKSIPFLVFISVYAVVTGHWSSWQAARVEARQEEIEQERIDREE